MKLLYVSIGRSGKSWYWDAMRASPYGARVQIRYGYKRAEGAKEAARRWANANAYEAIDWNPKQGDSHESEA